MKTKQNNNFNSMSRAVLLCAGAIVLAGCGAVPVRHVPKINAISGGKMADLHGSQPLDVKAGECSSEETKISSVGMGRVLGNMAEWTATTVEAARKNFS